MKHIILDKTGKKSSELELSDSIFNIEPNLTALSHYIRVYLSNQRQGTSSSLTRGEVSGTGKKPWKQKGTGRARTGSLRTPIFRHGGISHGPKPKSWTLSIPNKIKRLALLSALSLKVKNNNLKILEEITLNAPKTKEMHDLIKTLEVKGKTLLLLDKNDLNMRKSVENLANVSTALVENLNAYQVFKNRTLVMLKPAVKILEEKYENK